MRTRLLLVVAVLVFAGCVTTTERVAPPPRAGADMTEAARLNTELGVAYARNGEYEIAQEKLMRALEQKPDYAPAHAAMAFVYQQRGDAESAEEQYKRALRLDPRDPNTLNNYGIFLCGRNRHLDAEKQFLQAVAIPANKAPEKALTNAGVCARRIPDLARADRHLREALRLRPDDAEALQQMASLSLERKDFVRARAFLQRYEKVGKPTAQTLLIGAKVEAALGDQTSAADYARRLHAEFPESEESASLAAGPPS